MGIAIAAGFTLQSPVPLDDRYVFTTLAARDALGVISRHKGLLAYVEEDTTVYYLKAGITNGDWVPIGSGSGGGGGLNTLLSVSSKNLDTKDWVIPVGGSVEVVTNSALVYDECIKITLPSSGYHEVETNKVLLGDIFKSSQSYEVKFALKSNATSTLDVCLRFFDPLGIQLTQYMWSTLVDGTSTTDGAYRAYAATIKPFSPSDPFHSMAFALQVTGDTEVLIDNVEVSVVFPRPRKVTTLTTAGIYNVLDTDDLIVVKPSPSESSPFVIIPPVEARNNFTVKYVPKSNTLSSVEFSDCEDDVEMYSNSSRTFYFDNQDNIWRAL